MIRPTILICEDEELLRECMSSMLAMHDFNVLQACDAVECVEILKKNKIDIIISDVRMPGVSGLEMYEALPDNKPPVIFISGGCNNSDMNIIRRIKAALLLKPFSYKELVDQIKSTLHIQENVNGFK